jgi:hypothetical protein
VPTSIQTQKGIVYCNPGIESVGLAFQKHVFGRQASETWCCCPELTLALFATHFATPHSEPTDPNNKTAQSFEQDTAETAHASSTFPQKTLYSLCSSPRLQTTSLQLPQQPIDNNPLTTTATMSQPAPYNEEGNKGWWAIPQAFITLPFVVGSVCGHPLSGATLPPRATSIPAADLTHCSKCMPDIEAWTIAFPIADIPTVVGSVCKHALSGISTPIGPTATLAAVTKLCSTCTAFGIIAHELALNHQDWQDSVRGYNWTYLAIALMLRTPGSLAFMNPQEDDIVSSPLFRPYLSRRKDLKKLYLRMRVVYERNACCLQEIVDPALPIVNQVGDILVPLPGYASGPVAGAHAGQATPRHVTFYENQQHPSRETARHGSRYWRKAGEYYKPGKCADTTGRGFEDTSEVVLYTHDETSADDTPTEASSSGREGSPFSVDLVIYTPSSLPPQPKKAKQEAREWSSVSEK